MTTHNHDAHKACYANNDMDGSSLNGNDSAVVNPQEDVYESSKVAEESDNHSFNSQLLLSVGSIVTDLRSTDCEVENNELNEKNRVNPSGSPEAWSTNSDSPTPTNSAIERPWAKDKFWQSILGDEHRQLLGTEEESSDRHSSDDDIDIETIYQITNEQQEYYSKQFSAIQPDPNGLVTGQIARVFFEKSRIPVEELRHIWQLCDVTRDGALSIGEFTAAMHLVVLRRNNIPLPQTLPTYLNPSVLKTQMKTNLSEPPEADLLHLNDDDKCNLLVERLPLNVDTSKRIVPTDLANAANTDDHKSPLISDNSNMCSTSGSPQEQITQQIKNATDPTKEWINQSKEWTTFTESPTAIVSSPGPKPVNFDMLRTAQAVVSDPLILHPVPLRVTPIGSDAVDDETFLNDVSVNLDNTENSMKNLPPSANSINSNSQHQYREALQGSDVRVIQRPQAKKRQSKNISTIPPPPQRELSFDSDSNDFHQIHSTEKKPINTVYDTRELLPLPPPRPHRHIRSSSLDLNKLKIAHGSPFQKLQRDLPKEDMHMLTSSLWASERASAFEVYRKPNISRSSHSPDPLKLSQLTDTNSLSFSLLNDNILTTDSKEPEPLMHEAIQHFSSNRSCNISEVLHYLRDQNALLLQLCFDLNSELLTVQKRKEEIHNEAKHFCSDKSLKKNISNCTDSSVSENVI